MMRKKAAALLIIALLLLTLVPSFASANGPPPDTTITIKVTNAPAVVAYIDILVDENLPEMVMVLPPNQEVLTEYPVIANSALITCNSDGYRSYSLYYKHHAYSNDKQSQLAFSFTEGNRFSGAFDSDIHNIKIILMDGSGNVLQISNAISLAADWNNHLHAASSTVQYDYTANLAKVSFSIVTSSINFNWTIVALIFSAIIRMLFSTSVELIIALHFKMKPIKVIVVVNILTQIMISIGIPVFTISASYVLAVTVFEVLVYVIEFLAYMKFLHEPKWKTVLLYTVTANTASLLLGLVLNSMGFFWA